MMVYGLEAIVTNPFVDGPPLKKVNTTYAGAEQRVEKFKAAIRDQLQLENTYPIDVTITQFEVID